MSVYIELESSPLASTNSQSVANGGTGRAGAASVRRPLRGFEISEDTYALVKVVDAAGRPIPLANQGAYGAASNEWSNFLLQSVQEARMEKNSILETFGEAFIFFYGQHPINLQVSAVLLDTQDFRWAQEFRINYEKYFRGSKLSQLGGKLYMFYEDKIVEGLMMGCTLAKTAEQQNLEQLQFQLFVTNMVYTSDISDLFPIRPTAPIPGDLDIRKVLTSDEMKHLGYASAAYADFFGLEVDQFDIRHSTNPIRSYFADNVDEFTRPQENPFFNPRGPESAYWPPISDYGDASRMWGLVNNAGQYLKKDPTKALSPKEAFKSLKDSWNKAKKQYNAAEKTINAITTNGDAFFDDPDGYLKSKVENSKYYKDAKNWAEDAYAWGNEAAGWVSTADGDISNFAKKGFKGSPDYGPSTFPPSPLDRSEQFVQSILGRMPTPYGTPENLLWLQRRDELLKQFEQMGIVPKEPPKAPPVPPPATSPKGQGGYVQSSSAEEPDPFAGAKFSVTAIDEQKVVIPGQEKTSVVSPDDIFIPGHEDDAILVLCPV